MIPFQGRGPHFAYCIVHIDIRTTQIIRIGVYSDETPTSLDLQHEIGLQAHKMPGISYGDAARRLVIFLRDHPGAHRWLYDRLDESDRRLAL